MTLPWGAPSTSIAALHRESSEQNCKATAPPKEWPKTPTRAMSSLPVNLPDESEAFNRSKRSSTNAMSEVHAVSNLFTQLACLSPVISRQSSGLFCGKCRVIPDFGGSRRSHNHDWVGALLR